MAMDGLKRTLVGGVALGVMVFFLLQGGEEAILMFSPKPAKDEDRPSPSSSSLSPADPKSAPASSQAGPIPSVPAEITKAVPVEMQSRLEHLNTKPPTGLPKEYGDRVKNLKSRLETAFHSQSSAQAQLKNLEGCIEQAGTVGKVALPAGVQLPMSQGGSDIQVRMLSSCVRLAQKLVEKFPALRADYDARIARKVSPEILERSTK